MGNKIPDAILDDLLDGVPEKEDKREAGFQFGEAADNAWPSLIKYGEEMYNALANPKQTLEGLQGVASGYAQKAAAGDSPYASYSNPDNVALADAVTKDYTDAYGGITSGDFTKTLQTLEDDPFRVLSDVSGVISGGAGATGKALQLASKVPSKTSIIGKTLKGAGKAADVVADAGTYLDPVNNALRVPGAVVPTEFLYKHALLSSGGGAGLDPTQLKRAAKKGLDEKVRLTHNESGIVSQGTPFEGGNQKLRRLAGKKVREQKDIVAGMDDIPLEEMYTNVDDLAARKGTIAGSTDPVKDQARVNELAGTHRAAALSEYPEGQIPAEVVQQVKQTFGDKGSNVYNASALNPELGVDANVYAAVADSSRKALSKRSPLAGELDSVNRELTDLRYLQEAIDPAELSSTRGGIIGVDLGSRTLANALGAGQGGSAAIGVLASKLGQNTADAALLAKILREPNPKGTVARSGTVASGRITEEAEKRRALDELEQLLYGGNQ
jgi:hypothetical protein